MRLLTALLCALALSGCLSMYAQNEYFKPQPRHSGTKMAKGLALELGVGALVFGAVFLARQDSVEGSDVPIAALEGAGGGLLVDLNVALIITIVGLLRGDPDPPPKY